MLFGIGGTVQDLPFLRTSVRVLTVFPAGLNMHFTTSGGNHVLVVTLKERGNLFIILLTGLTGFHMKGATVNGQFC